MRVLTMRLHKACFDDTFNARKIVLDNWRIQTFKVLPFKFQFFSERLKSFSASIEKFFQNSQPSPFWYIRDHVNSVTRLGDLLDFGQPFKAFGNN